MFSIASGALPPSGGRPGLKFFAYCGVMGDALVGTSNWIGLFQLTLYFDTREVFAVMKTDCQSLPPQTVVTKLADIVMLALAVYGPSL